MKKVTFVALAFAFSTAVFAQQTTKTVQQTTKPATQTKTEKVNTPAKVTTTKNTQEVKKVALAKQAPVKADAKKPETKTTEAKN